MSKTIDAPTKKSMSAWLKTQKDIERLQAELFKSKYQSEIDAFISYIVKNKKALSHFESLNKTERIMIFESIVDNYESILPFSKPKRDEYRVKLEKRKVAVNNKKLAAENVVQAPIQNPYPSQIINQNE